MQPSLLTASPVLHLSCGSHTMTLAPTAGGRILRFQTRREASHDNQVDHDWFVPLDAKQWLNNDWPKGGCYPLVPFSNRVRDGRFTPPGHKEIRLSTFPQAVHALHGFGQYHPWEILGVTNDSALLGYRHHADLDGWPWEFQAIQSIRLTEHGAHLTMRVDNLSAGEMPVGLGFHPYFAAERAALTATTQWRHEAEIATEPMTGTPANLYGKEQGGYTCYLGGWDGRANLFYENGAQLALTTNHVLSHVVVHAPANAAYLCVEPVSHVSDGFNLAAMGWPDTGIHYLANHKSIEASLDMLVVR